MNSQDEAKFLFVASTGGHLAQLLRLSVTMNASPDSVWVTFRTPQSESMLAGRRVVYVPYVRSRDIVGVLRASRVIRELLKSETFDRAVSTGAALAVAALPQARLRRIPTLYIESVSRVDGPSLTGRIIAATGTAALRTQHSSWARGRWRAQPSVFGTYSARPRPTTERPRILVTLGTIEGYRFDSVVDAVLRTGLADERTVWQVGDTTRDDLPGRVVTQFELQEFQDVARNSDVVVSHAGVGTVLDLLELGRYPVLVPRRKSRSEHVDDHQEQIARLISRMEVARVVEATELVAQDLVRASGFTVVHGESAL